MTDRNQHRATPEPTPFDPFGILTSYANVQFAWLKQPVALSRQLAQLAAQGATLGHWQGLNAVVTNPDLVPPVEYDARFGHPLWEVNPLLDTFKEFYLMSTRWILDTTYETPNLDEHEKRKSAFWARQTLNALAPNNFFWSNPKAILRCLETHGGSVAQGCRNFMTDYHRGTISMVREDAFTVGEDLATSPGSVVFRNELVELIQYAPATERVHAIPVVLITPWINKYYVLDLTPKKSLVKYLVDQGFTVFITSWKNPGPEMRDTTMEDYMLLGVHDAIEAARDICQAPQVHLMGYCIGGTLVTAYMAWLNHPEQGDKQPVAHWSLLASLADFEEPGDIDIFISEKIIQYIEAKMHKSGYLDGNDMALTFRLLRSNSLIWDFVVRQYLCGEAPPEFDILFWNMDTTRMPEAMHRFYLREFYLHNNLAKQNGLSLAGRQLDLSRITQPLYAVGAEQDHIVPWTSSFKTCHLVSSPTRYVLATSGHILGIISPPLDPPKRRYWASDVTNGCRAKQWLSATEKTPGSWWQDWAAWLRPQCGELKTPPAMGSDTFPCLESAPGTYVLQD